MNKHNDFDSCDNRAVLPGEIDKSIGLHYPSQGVRFGLVGQCSRCGCRQKVVNVECDAACLYCESRSLRLVGNCEWKRFWHLAVNEGRPYGQWIKMPELNNGYCDPKWKTRQCVYAPIESKWLIGLRGMIRGGWHWCAGLSRSADAQNGEWLVKHLLFVPVYKMARPVLRLRIFQHPNRLRSWLFRFIGRLQFRLQERVARVGRFVSWKWLKASNILFHGLLLKPFYSPHYVACHKSGIREEFHWMWEPENDE